MDRQLEIHRSRDLPIQMVLPNPADRAYNPTILFRIKGLAEANGPQPV